MADEQHHDLEQWPEILRRLAAIIGPELTLQLAAEHGGRTKTMIVPRERRRHPWRSVIVDDAQWARVVAELGSSVEPVHLPRGAYLTKLKKVEVMELAEAGVSVGEIVRRLGITERYARRVLAAVRSSQPAPVPLPRKVARAVETAMVRELVGKKRKRRRKRRQKGRAEKAEAVVEARRRRRIQRIDPGQLKLF